MKATVKESGIILDPKQFLEWGHQQLKKIEKERLHKSSKVVMVCLKEKGKNIKIDGDFMNKTYDDCQDTVKKKKKKKKGQSEQETISSINIELNKQTKQSEEDETKKRKRSGCVDEVEESESSSSKKKEGGKKKKTKAQAEDSNDERKTKKGKRAAGNGIPIRAEESDLPSNDKKKKKRQTSVDEETERPKKKKRKIAEDSLPCDASMGKRKKQDMATYLHHSDSDHEFTSSSKKKKNTQHLETQPNGDVHSKYTDHAESNLSKHKKKKKKKKKRENVNEVETEEDQQLLETKRRKKAELKEIVELDYSNDTHIKKKKKKKKREDNSEASDNTCSSLSHKRKKSKEDGFENGDSIHEKKRIRSSEVDERVVSSKRSEQAHCCGHCPSSSRPGFGKSPISRLLSKNMTCDICPGKLYRQELEDIPSTPKTPVVIKQERMEDWVGYNIEKELDISARVKKEPEEQLVNAAPSLTIKSEKTDNRDVQEKQTGDEQPVAEMNAVWIKEERFDSNEASQENNDDNIRPAESVKVEIVVEEVSEAVAPSNDNTSLDNNIEDDSNNKYRNNNDDDDYNINNTTGTENICSTENNILQSDEVDSSTYINFYDDNFNFKDEFVNFDDQTAIDPLQEAGNKDSDYLQCVISQFSSEASDRTMLQCTISAQDEGRRVTALDAESEMLHFMNVYPKFQDRLQVSRILKVPIKHTYFHHYVVGTKELMDVYVQFKRQQDLKTAMQFYARRVRCEQWCTVPERSLPQEIENDPDANEVQNPYHQWCCEGYKKPSSQNRNTPRQQKKRYYQHRRRKQNSRQVNWKGSGSARRRC